MKNRPTRYYGRTNEPLTKLLPNLEAFYHTGRNSISIPSGLPQELPDSQIKDNINKDSAPTIYSRNSRDDARTTANFGDYAVLSTSMEFIPDDLVTLAPIVMTTDTGGEVALTRVNVDVPGLAPAAGTLRKSHQQARSMLASTIRDLFCVPNIPELLKPDAR